MQDSGHNQVRWFCQGLVWLGFQGVSLRERRPRWRGPGEGQEHAGDISEGVWISVISMSLWAKGPRGPTVPRSPRVGALLPPRVSPLQVSWGPCGGGVAGHAGVLARGPWLMAAPSALLRDATCSGRGGPGQSCRRAASRQGCGADRVARASAGLRNAPRSAKGNAQQRKTPKFIMLNAPTRECLACTGKRTLDARLEILRQAFASGAIHKGSHATGRNFCQK